MNKKFNKFFLAALFLGFFNRVYSEPLKDVGIAKYAVLEVRKDNSPLRQKDDENAKRITHLLSDTILYADKQNNDYFRVELDNNNYGFINKKFVEVQAIIPEKRPDNIEKIIFKELKDKYLIKMELNSLSPFLFEENGNKLKFSLYDNRFDPTEVKISNSLKNFSIPNRIENNFEMNYMNSYPLFGYGVEKYEKGYIISIKKPPIVNPKHPLKNIKIVIDSGHGGIEKGACAFNLEEKTINLKISKKLKNELKKKGAKVYLTRSKDKQVDLYERIDFAKEKNADILLSIHQNSLANKNDINKKYGTGTYYYNLHAKSLAEFIKQNLVKATDFRDDGTNYASFALTRPTTFVSVLVECGYLIKEDEAQKLNNKKFQKIIAKAITKGVEEYLIFNFAKTK